MAYCGKCGSKLLEGNRFCVNCGAEIPESALEILKTDSDKPQTGADNDEHPKDSEPTVYTESSVSHSQNIETETGTINATKEKMTTVEPVSKKRKVNPILIGAAIAVVVIVLLLVIYYLLFIRLSKRNIAGTYLGDAGCGMILYEDGRADYCHTKTNHYGLEENDTWTYNAGKLTVVLNSCSTYANVRTKHQLSDILFLDGGSGGWDDEIYHKISDETRPLTEGEFYELIAVMNDENELEKKIKEVYSKPEDDTLKIGNIVFQIPRRLVRDEEVRKGNGIFYRTGNGASWLYFESATDVSDEKWIVLETENNLLETLADNSEVPNVQEINRKKDNIAGMPAITNCGVGDINGVSMQVTVSLIHDTDGIVCIMYYYPKDYGDDCYYPIYKKLIEDARAVESTVKIDESVSKEGGDQKNDSSEAYKITDMTFDYHETSIGTIQYFGVVEITNQGNTDLYLKDCVFDLEDNSGHLLKSDNYTVYKCPSVIGPGEKGYFYNTLGTIDNDISLSNGVKLVPTVKIETAKNRPHSYPVSDVSIRNEDFNLGVGVTGRITNDTDKEEPLINIQIVFFDQQKKAIGFASTYVTNVASGSKASFEASDILSTADMEVSDIESYQVYALEKYIQF